MRKFLTRAGLFGGGILLSLLTINILLWHYPFANSRLERAKWFEDIPVVGKSHSFLRHDSATHYNTIFFGSSRIYRHIDPLLFDSLLAADTRSYNMAYSNLFPYRLYDVMEMVLERRDNNGLTVFIELAPLAEVGPNYKTVQIQHATSFTRLETSRNYAYEYLPSGSQPVFETEITFFRTIVWKYLSFELIKEIYNRDERKLRRWDREKLSVNGFVSLDKESGSYFTRNRNQDIDLTPFYKVDYSIPAGNDNDPYFLMTLRYIDFLKTLGVKDVYFILPPRADSNHMAALIRLKKQLLQKEVMVFDLSNPQQYPDLFKAENSFNAGHLNGYGARLCTMALVDQVKLYNAQRPD